MSIIQEQIAYYKSNEKDPFFLNELEEAIQKAADTGDDKDLTDRFYTELEFGTGGIRGIMGAGVNRLNPLVVRTIATGWAKYLTNTYQNTEIKVVIARDSRNFSDVFCDIVSCILCAHGVHVYAFVDPRPTPQLSFTMRDKGAQSGMVITASHNPPAYNGLKIYGDDGGQVVPPHDKKVMEYIASVEPAPVTQTIKQIKQSKLYHALGDEDDETFHAYVKRVAGEPVKKTSDYSVVYTPLHGTGAVHVETLAKAYGIPCIIEPSQKNPDGNFPTVEYPNPEDSKALANAIQTAEKSGASLVAANDPDADRVGIAEKQSDGKFLCLNGNQIGSLLLDYVISKKSNGVSGTVFVNTIVTTTLQEKIARNHGMETMCCYTGFKNIALCMLKAEREGKPFLFGCEESYGYLASDEVRDKDGISTVLLCMQMAREYHTQGKRLTDRLQELYITYGYHEERAVSKTFPGKEGKKRMQAIMHMVRENTPTSIGGVPVAFAHDYLRSTARVINKTAAGDENPAPIDLPPGDVFMFTMEGGNKLCVRPSGTEPKIKFYLLYSSSPSQDYETSLGYVSQLLDKAEQEVHEWLK